MVHLVTGYAGSEHIKSADQGSFNAAFFGDGQYVMEIGSQLEGSIINNNTVRILDGDLLMHGRHIRIEPDTYEDMVIETGTAGTNRIDLICMTYEKNALDGTEISYLEVIKGNETPGTALVPEYSDGNILNGASKNQMPLYQVKIEGVALVSITPLFEIIPTYKTLAEQYAEKFKADCESHLNSLAVLDTTEEIEANTQENQLAGALALKEVLSLANNTSDSIAEDWDSDKAYSFGECCFYNGKLYKVNAPNSVVTNMLPNSGSSINPWKEITVASELANVNKALDIKSYTVNIENGTGSIYLRKMGRIVFATIALSGITLPTQWNYSMIATIPDECKPLFDQNNRFISGYGVHCVARITTANLLIIQPITAVSNSALDYLYWSVAYLSAT